MGVQYICSLDSSQPMTLDIFAGAAVTNGQLLMVSSGKVVKATAAATKVIGICMKTVATGDIGTIKTRVMLLNSKSVIRVSYSGATVKQALADADLWGTSAFDIDSDQVLNLEDTTGGFLIPITTGVVATNVASTSGTGTTDVVVKSSALWHA